LDKRLDRLQSRSLRGDEEKNSQLLPGLEPPFIRPVAQCCTTELTRLVTNNRAYAFSVSEFRAINIKESTVLVHIRIWKMAVVACFVLLSWLSNGEIKHYHGVA
jgi:hypothetical protein